MTWNMSVVFALGVAAPGDMVRERVREVARQVCEEIGVTIIKGVLSTDHVHMFVSIPPTMR
ncbi:MAG: transposase [Alphaproteobacteria bacterium]|nr:transposase [Alphaproteobacteria bacterium]